MFNLTYFLVVFIGSGLGGICRYGLTCLTNQLNNNLALMATNIIINIIGSFAITLLINLFQPLFALQPILRLLLITGLLGGFTSFSAFSFDFISLIHQKNYLLAISYVVISVVTTLMAAAIGYKL